MMTDKSKFPKHIAIIMDGNGRWAKKRGLPRSAGHAAGAVAFRRIALYCQKIGLKYMTIYAFSTENWTRPEEEVNAILELLYKYLNDAVEKLTKDKIHLNFIGDLSKLPEKLQSKIEEISAMNRDNYEMLCNIALNYGGRQEIVHAVNAFISKYPGRKISEEELVKGLYTGSQPDPDLVIRTSGEMRMSNFLLWQTSYAELYFTNVLWPDIKEKHIDMAIEEFANRNRRYGGI